MSHGTKEGKLSLPSLHSRNPAKVNKEKATRTHKDAHNVRTYTAAQRAHL